MSQMSNIDDGEDHDQDGLPRTSGQGHPTAASSLIPNTLESSTSSNPPTWMKELVAAYATRNSRASSIVSTRTRFSTNTFQDDARSIDINVGGQFFRISRDGSQINDAPPPPYSLPPLATASLRSRQTRSNHAFDPNVARSGEASQRQQNLALEPNHNISATILDPGELDMPSPVDKEGTVGHAHGNRTAFNRLEPSDQVLANDSNRGIFVNNHRLRTMSSNDLQQAAFSPYSRRRKRPFLPQLVTQDLLYIDRSTAAEVADGTQVASDLNTSLQTRSAGPVLSRNLSSYSSLSPELAIWAANSSGSARNAGNGTSERFDPFPTLRTESPLGTSNDTETEGSPTPLAMDNENDISLHYARMMRKLDKDHRQALHTKDKELAQYRERINEIDTVYRQQLRARDFLVDDLKKRLEFLEVNTETMLEKARNEVEDIWEQRWKDQEFRLLERIRRIEVNRHNDAGQMASNS